jgi:hypothetical protein
VLLAIPDKLPIFSVNMDITMCKLETNFNLSSDLIYYAPVVEEFVERCT